DEASKVLEGVGEHLDSMGKMGQVAKVGLAAAAAGLTVAVEMGTQFVEAAEKEQAVRAKLRQAIADSNVVEIQEMATRARDAVEIENINYLREHQSEIVERKIGQIGENIAAMERQSAFSKHELSDALSLLIEQTGNLDDATG